MGVGDSLLLLSLSWKPIFLLWRMWPCVTQTRKSVSMWSANPQPPIKSNNAKVPLLITLQHSLQSKSTLDRFDTSASLYAKSKVHYHHGRKTQITHYFFFCCKSTEYPLHWRNRRSGTAPTIWSTISIFTRYFEDLVRYCANDLVDYFVIHSLFPSRQLSLAPPRESQPYLQNESCSTLSFYVHQLIVWSIQSL